MIDVEHMTDDELRDLLDKIPPNEELTSDDKAVLAEAERRDLDF